nr:probable E3 ubiquitin-protein ligase RHC2A [Tanacetum cinerariifolium]
MSLLSPVIILRGNPPTHGGFEMYYDDGVGSGLRPLPVSMSEFLLGSGFDRLLEQLTQIEANGLGLGRVDPSQPASKAAIEALETIDIKGSHVASDLHCAVCKDVFELKTEVKEMPCKHLYHSECIIPWLSLRNSCPVCRHELPLDNNNNNNNNENEENESMGLTIWRLPGGGFAVGRRGREDIPIVFNEIVSGFDVDGSPDRGLGGNRGLRRVFGGVFSCFGGGVRRRVLSSSSSSSSDDGVSYRSRFIPALFSSSSRRERAWAIDVNNRPQDKILAEAEKEEEKEERTATITSLDELQLRPFVNEGIERPAKGRRVRDGEGEALETKRD